MTPAPRYDQRWQITHRIAELIGEQKIIQFQIKQKQAQYTQLDQEIRLLQSNLDELTQGETS